MRNSLTDLNNHLFHQLERLMDDDSKGEVLEEELKRTKGVTDVASKIIGNAELVLEAAKFGDERMDIDKDFPKMLK